MSDIVRTSQEIIEKLVISEEVAASGTFTSSAIDLTSSVSALGNLAIQVEVTGDGTASLTYTASIDGTDYVSPTGATAIATGLTKTVNTTGKDIYEFSPILAKFIKIVITETGTSDTVTINATLIAQ